MKIAFLDSWHQTSFEGSGTAVGINGLQRALRNQGHTITRLAPTNPWPKTLTLRRLLFNLKLPALLSSLSYDLIVGFDIDGFLWSNVRGRGTPYMTSVHGVLAEEARHERGSVFAELWSLSRLELLNARAADLVQTTSEYCRAAIQRNYGVAREKIRVMPSGIPLARWQRIVRETPHHSDGATILCVARQYPRKHVADLLRAMPEVRRVVPNARALIVGDGPEHASLRALHAQLNLGSAVALLGAIPDDDELARMYRQADIFCLPSVQEGFGLVFLEAMAAGLPIVATRSAAIPEVVPDRQAGILVPPASPPDLAQALIELLQNPQQRTEYGTFGQQYVRRYDWDSIAHEFIELAVSIGAPRGHHPNLHRAAA